MCWQPVKEPERQEGNGSHSWPPPPGLGRNGGDGHWRPESEQEVVPRRDSKAKSNAFPYMRATQLP